MGLIVGGDSDGFLHGSVCIAAIELNGDVASLAGFDFVSPIASGGATARGMHGKDRYVARPGRISDRDDIGAAGHPWKVHDVGRQTDGVGARDIGERKNKIYRAKKPRKSYHS